MTVDWIGQTWAVEDKRASSIPHFLLSNEKCGEVIILPHDVIYQGLAEKTTA